MRVNTPLSFPFQIFLLPLITIFSLLFCFFPQPTHSHGRLLEPPMRASLWRFPEFAHLNPPTNYDDDAFWCGAMATQYGQNGGKCGVCGDNWADPVPRSHEDGWRYGRGVIVRNYTSGQTIPITVDLTGAHSGHFTFQLCPRNTPTDPETEECYSSNQLLLTDGRVSLPVTTKKGLYKTSVVLPLGIKCSRCSIRWHYRTGNNWGDCGDGRFAVGCGDQETFRGCADVAIY